MITEYAICALPEDNVNWRHYAIKVQRRGNTDRWVLNWGGFYYDGHSGWSPSISDAVECPEHGGVALAEDLAPDLDVNGISVAEALQRSNR